MKKKIDTIENNNTHYILNPDQLRRTWLCVYAEKGPRFAYEKSNKKQWDLELLAASYADECGYYDIIIEEKQFTTIEARKWAENL
jgi:hypothetical protein